MAASPSYILVSWYVFQARGSGSVGLAIISSRMV
jgi:hypothetical protein